VTVNFSVCTFLCTLYYVGSSVQFYDYYNINIITDMMSMIYNRKLYAGQHFSWLWASELADVLFMNIN